MDSTALQIVCNIILNFVLESAAVLTMELELVRVELLAGEDYIESDLRVRNLNRTTHSLNGTWILLKDLDESYEFSIGFSYSSLGNNQFNEYPMKIHQQNLCQFLADEYPEYQYLWANYTNLPPIAQGTKMHCPFPKGEYWVRDLVPDSAWIPPVVPTGLWRLVATLWNKEKERLTDFRYYFKVEKKLGSI